MAQIKLDENGNPITPTATKVDENGNPIAPVATAPVTEQPAVQPETSIGKQLWSKANESLTNIGLDPKQRAVMEETVPWTKGIGFGTDVLNSLITPLNIATAGAAGGANVAARAGLPLIAKTANVVSKGLEAATAAEGAHTAFTGDTWAERIGGGLQAGLGILGMKSKLPAARVRMPSPDLPAPPIDFLPEHQISMTLNPKGVSGQIPPRTFTTPTIGSKATLNVTTRKVLNEKLMQGYVPGGVGPDGRPFMIFKGRPIPLEEIDMPPVEKTSIMRELYNLPRGLTTAWDLSAPGRQGLPLVTTKSWWTSWVPMIKSLGSEESYKQVMTTIRARPNFKETYEPVFKDGKWAKKRVPSFAEKSGLAIADLKGYSSREEALKSMWAEKVPGIRNTNQAYTAYLNQLRADTFDSLIKDAENIFMKASQTGKSEGWLGTGFRSKALDPKQIASLNPKENLVLAKEIADFVNTATGRGPLRTKVLSHSDVEGIHFKEKSLEESAEALTKTLFSPRLVASRVRMLNPATYIAASPQVRYQYLKALFSTAAAWGTVATLAKAGGADVVLDTENSDFGKIKIGNTRLDPAAGFQQYLVLASRLLQGETVSSTNPRKKHELGAGYEAPTRTSVGIDFSANKLHPTLKFAYDLFDASGYKSMQIGDRVAQMFVPLVAQDLIELAKEDPALAWLAIPTAIGMGTQTYEKGKQKPVMVPKGIDVTWKGGKLF